MTLAEEPVFLDDYRGAAARETTESRRESLEECQVELEALQRRQKELERLIFATRADAWPEAAAKAQYLIELLAATPAAQDLRLKEMIANALSDLKRLCDRAREDK